MAALDPKDIINSICILRLSAIGDVTHMVPIIHSLQKFSPKTKITWVIGTTEFKLLEGLPNVEFIQFNKKRGLKAYIDIRQQLKNRHFDILLACQVSLRANILATLISAKRKIGYDKARAKDLHGLVINERIPPANVHVLDSFFQFVEQIGISHKSLDWNIPISEEDQSFADQTIPNTQPILAISPCSSHALRNWAAPSYAAVANYANKKYAMQIVLLGGNNDTEIAYGEKICSLLDSPAINLIGKDTLKKLLAILKRSTILLSPDSGPAHMATCVNTPVIGLYAASNSLRSGPYLSSKWCVDKYSVASQHHFNKSTDQLKWGTKIEKPGVMDFIQPEDVIMKLDQLMENR